MTDSHQLTHLIGTPDSYLFAFLVRWALSASKVTAFGKRGPSALRAPRRPFRSTKRLWYSFLRNDLESANIDSINRQQYSLISSIFVSHLFHLGLVLSWVSVNLMQIAWQGTYSSWLTLLRRQLDRHTQFEIGLSGIDGLSSRIVSTSGLYHWLYAIGFRWNSSLMVSATLVFGSASFLTVGAIFHAMHLSSSDLYPHNAATTLDGASIFVNQLITGIGLACILWSGHIIHVSGPVYRGIAIKWATLLLLLPHPDGLTPLLSLRWNEYADILTAS